MSGRYARVPGTHWRERAQEVPLEAHGLWALARSYMADNRTDGFVEEAWLVGMCGGKLNRKAVDALLAAGWWEHEGGGYRDVRYLKDNISREKANERAAKTLTRVHKHRGKDVTGPPDNDGGNGGRNRSRNADCNGVTSAVTQDSHDDHDDHDTQSASRSMAREGPTPAGIVEGALRSALGETGAKLWSNAGDVAHYRDAAGAMKAADARPLRDVALEWCRDFVVEFRVRTAKNLALYAQSRAANGGAKVVPLARPAKPSGWAPPADHSQFTNTDLDAAFGKESAQ